MLTAAEKEDMLFDIESAAEWQDMMIADGLLPFWVVTYNTLRYPGIYVARPATVPAHGNGGAGVEALYYQAILVAPTQAVMQRLLPSGMTQIPRTRDDHPDIVERWVG